VGDKAVTTATQPSIISPAHISVGGVNWTGLDCKREWWPTLVNMAIHPQVPLRAEYLTIYAPTGHSRTLRQGVSELAEAMNLSPLPSMTMPYCE